MEVPPSPDRSVAGTENSGMTPEEEDVELGDIKETTENSGMTSQEVDANKIAVEKKHRPSNALSIVTVDADEENAETWKEIARALDRIFFWVFLALFVLSTIVIYGQAGRLASLDKLKFWVLGIYQSIPGLVTSGFLAWLGEGSLITSLHHWFFYFLVSFLVYYVTC